MLGYLVRGLISFEHKKDHMRVSPSPEIHSCMLWCFFTTRLMYGQDIYLNSSIHDLCN